MAIGVFSCPTPAARDGAGERSWPDSSCEEQLQKPLEHLGRFSPPQADSCCLKCCASASLHWGCIGVLKHVTSCYVFGWEMDLQMNSFLCKKNRLDVEKWVFSEGASWLKVKTVTVLVLQWSILVWGWPSEVARIREDCFFTSNIFGILFLISNSRNGDMF